MSRDGVRELKKQGKAFKDGSDWYLEESLFFELIESRKSLNEIVRELGIHRRVWYASIRRYGDKLWKELEHARRSRKMRGNTNGAHPPSVLIPRDEIVERLQRGEPATNLMRDYNISERLFHRNLAHYDLSDWFRDLQAIRLPHRLMEDEGRLSLLERIFPKAYEAIQQPTPDNAALQAIRRAQIELLDLAYWIKDIGRRLKYRQEHRTGKKSPVIFSTNRGECLVERELLARVIEYIPQFEIPNGEGSFFYDFFLPGYQVIIEVDGSVHSRRRMKRDALRHVKHNDAEKEAMANAQGIPVHRVTFTHEKNRNRLLDELDAVLDELRP